MASVDGRPQGIKELDYHDPVIGIRILVYLADDPGAPFGRIRTALRLDYARLERFLKTLTTRGLVGETTASSQRKVRGYMLTEVGQTVRRDLRKALSPLEVSKPST